MDKYKKYQFIATICVALFIVNFSICLLVMNRSVYNKCTEDYEFVSDDGNPAITVFEARLNYEQLADDFTSFFKSDYSLPGYEILGANIERLNDIKTYYRWAWVISILSFAGAVYSFIILSKRRYYMPLLYGGVLSALMTSVNAFILLKSDNEVFRGIRNMVLNADYGYFKTGDIITKLIPDGFAGWMALTYLLIVFLMILAMVLIRLFIIYCGRPHKF